MAKVGFIQIGHHDSVRPVIANIARVDPFWFVWTPFALLALYVPVRRQLADQGAATATGTERLAEPG